MIFNILIIGPAESGKTTFIENISRKIDKRFKKNIINIPNFDFEIPDKRLKRLRKTSIGMRFKLIEY